MAEEYGDNVWDELPDLGDGISGRRLVREEGRPLAGAVWELAPGSRGVRYHFHHGTEEYLVVLRGTATLRTPEGERQLPEGSVMHFSPGPGGAHAVMNLGEEPVRYLMVGAHTSPDIVEYLDEGTSPRWRRRRLSAASSSLSAYRCRTSSGRAREPSGPCRP